MTTKHRILTMAIVGVVALIAVTGLVGAAIAFSGTQAFSLLLESEQEVPPFEERAVRARLDIQVQFGAQEDGIGEICFALRDLIGIEPAEIVRLHIHSAPKGSNSGISLALWDRVLDILPAPPPGLKGCRPAPMELLNALRDGQFLYFNIHTEGPRIGTHDFPAGVARSQGDLKLNIDQEVTIEILSPAVVLAGNDFVAQMIIQSARNIGGVVGGVSYPAENVSFLSAVPDADISGCLNGHNASQGDLRLAVACGSPQGEGTRLDLFTVRFATTAEVKTDMQVDLTINSLEVVSGDAPPTTLPVIGKSTAITLFTGACGDADHSGSPLGIKDVVFALQSAADLLTPDPFQAVLGDVDRDSSVSVIDAANILQSVLGHLVLAECGPIV